MSAVAKREDQALWFLTYLTTGGDLERSSAALQVPLPRLAALAREFDWAGKLKAQQGAPAGESGPQLMRQINRTVNHVQAHQLRELCSSVMKIFQPKPGETEEESAARLEKLVTVFTPKGCYVDTSPLKNLASAIESAQALSYRALGDSADKTVEESSGALDPKKAQALFSDALRMADQNPGITAIEAVRAVTAGTKPSDYVAEAG